MKSTDKIKILGKEIIDLLVEKNGKYGDSALNPINIFSDGDAVNSLCARIDDKLSRIRNNGINVDTEDTVKDLCGYLILLLLARDKEKEIFKPNRKEVYDSNGHKVDTWVTDSTYSIALCLLKLFQAILLEFPRISFLSTLSLYSFLIEFSCGFPFSGLFIFIF